MGGFSCIICEEELSSSPKPAGDESGSGGGAGDGGSDLEVKVVTTPCGHVFHQDCIDQWFKVWVDGEQKRAEQSGQSFVDKGMRNCPFCVKALPKDGLIRLYLVSSDIDAEEAQKNFQAQVQEIDLTDSRFRTKAQLKSDLESLQEAADKMATGFTKSIDDLVKSHSSELTSLKETNEQMIMNLMKSMDELDEAHRESESLLKRILVDWVEKFQTINDSVQEIPKEVTESVMDCQLQQNGTDSGACRLLVRDRVVDLLNSNQDVTVANGSDHDDSNSFEQIGTVVWIGQRKGFLTAGVVFDQPMMSNGDPPDKEVDKAALVKFIAVQELILLSDWKPEM